MDGAIEGAAVSRRGVPKTGAETNEAPAPNARVMAMPILAMMLSSVLPTKLSTLTAPAVIVTANRMSENETAVALFMLQFLTSTKHPGMFVALLMFADS